MRGRPRELAECDPMLHGGRLQSTAVADGRLFDGFALVDVRTKRPSCDRRLKTALAGFEYECRGDRLPSQLQVHSVYMYASSTTTRYLHMAIVVSPPKIWPELCSSNH